VRRASSVNVTAGMDLSIGEFQEVGNVIKQFASDDATVVVGTVIDPEMANQIRVTVVATGLGRPVAKAHRNPSRDDRTAAAEYPCGQATRRPSGDRLRDARQADGAAPARGRRRTAQRNGN
jgi:cell division protein FtsZ